MHICIAGHKADARSAVRATPFFCPSVDQTWTKKKSKPDLHCMSAINALEPGHNLLSWFVGTVCSVLVPGPVLVLGCI